MGQYLLQESTKSKVHPELIHPECDLQAKTYNRHNGSTKKDNNKESEGASVRAGRL